MSRKRVSGKAVRDIASARIDRLYAAALEAVAEDDWDYAARYVEMMLAISRRTKAPIPREHRYCKGCRLPLVAGATCTVRLSNHKVIITCGNCNTIRRLPYLREQRNDRKAG
ncbi:MAG: ribonuclease P protein component 4 [Thermoplasmatales archaeon]|nr:ribonuclease P protein component 4 [Thermoplasmatales archaeon]